VGDDGLEAIRGPLGRLFRLGASRKVHARQVAVAGVEISPPGAALLARIVEDGPIALGDLSAAADMDPGAVSRQVKALEGSGLVERGGREGDARVRVLRATPAGRRVRRRIADVQDRHMADVLEGWSAADRATFAHLLDRFVEDLRSVQYRASDQRRSA
jgi:DNA-binding MarR family transcriptional regulator